MSRATELEAEWTNKNRLPGGVQSESVIVAVYNRAPTMIGLVSLDMGATLLPETCMKLPHGGAVFRPLAEPVKTRIEIVWREHNLSRPLQHFIQIVRERFAASQ